MQALLVALMMRMQHLEPSWQGRYRRVLQPQDFPLLEVALADWDEKNVFFSKDVLVIRYEGPKGSPGMPEVRRHCVMTS